MFGCLKPATDAVEFRIFKFFQFQFVIVAFGHVRSLQSGSCFSLRGSRSAVIAAVTGVTRSEERRIIEWMLR
jgi:hypothetical protein